LQTKKEKEILLKANNNASTAEALDRKLFNYMATHLRNTSYPGAENYTRYTVARLEMLPFAGIEPFKPEYFDFIFQEVLLLQIVSELVIVPEFPFYILCKVTLEHEGNYKEIDASSS
jgi:hypothetical protein